MGGLILGKHEKFDDRGTGRKPYEILEEVMGDYNFPFLAEVDCCHTHPMFTMPIGVRKCNGDRQDYGSFDPCANCECGKILTN